jgi:signal transduction histidine kinase
LNKTIEPLKAGRRVFDWLDRSIQHKLIFWSIGFWIISVSILGITVSWIGQSEIIDQTSTRNVQLASVIGRDVNSQISQVFADTRTFSRHLQAIDPGLGSQADALLALKLSSTQRYGSIYYFDNNGGLLFFLNDNVENLIALESSQDILSRPPIKVNPEVTSSFHLTQSSVRYVSDVSFKGFDLTPVVYLGIPLNFSGGQHRVVVFEIDLRDIWQRIDLSTIGRSGFTFAVSRQGQIIAHPKPAFLSRQIPDEIKPVLQGFEGSTQYRDPSEGQDVIAAYSPVGGETGWGIVVVQDRSEAYALIIQAELIIIGIWLLLALAGTFGIFIMIRNFTRPILKLTRTASAIAATGDLTKTTALDHQPDEVGQLSQAFDRMVERLQKSEGRLAQAAAEERNRLARDLHDAVSQTLFSASLIADVVPRLWDRNQTEARKRLEEIRQLTRGALAEMRTLLLELRPAALVEAEIGHLLHQLGESINGRARIPVSVSIEGECLVSADIKVALYRIAQEALNNVAKHSGAKQAAVGLICTPREITLSISDNGRGFDASAIHPESLGVGIIRERAREIGASLTIESSTGNGTRITVVWRNTQLNNTP